MQLSAGATALRSSAIRDLLAVAERPEVLSLAGGLPCADAIPVDDIAVAVAAELAEGSGGLQYSSTEGDVRLRAWVADAAGHGATADDVLITTGSQQALDLVCRAVLGPGDHVAADDPLYLGASQVLQLTGAVVHPLAVDRDGLDVDRLAALLDDGVPIKVVYTVGSFQNPTGATLSSARRAALGALADRHGIVVVEDDPYGHLRWEGTAPEPLAAHTANAVRLGTSSKTVAGGLRVGWAVLRQPVLRAACTRIKQATDLHTSTLAQRVLVRLFEQPGWYDAQVARIVPLYRDRALALDAALRTHTAGRLEWDRPSGGMFLWARVLDDGGPVDTQALLAGAIERGVAFVPGGAFSETATDRFRLSFSVLAPSDFDEAARRLAESL